MNKHQAEVNLILCDQWHRAGWNDGVRHERERARCLFDALKCIQYSAESNDPFYRIAKQALEQYRREGTNESNNG